jgi:hypothetical protein
MFLLTQQKNGIVALELKRHFGVSYLTAWRVKHKLLQVMKERDDSRQLCGVIQVDYAYWGGERHDDTPGRGSPNKVPFIAALACNDEGHPIALRMGMGKVVITIWLAARKLAPCWGLTSRSVCVTCEFGCSLRPCLYPGPSSTRNASEICGASPFLSLAEICDGEVDRKSARRRHPCLALSVAQQRAPYRDRVKASATQRHWRMTRPRPRHWSVGYPRSPTV